MTRDTPSDSRAGPAASIPGPDQEPSTTATELGAAEFLISALDVAGELILVRGRGGRVVHVNAAFVAAFGGVRSDWVGRWFSVAPPVTTDDPRRYEMLMRTRQGPLWIEWDERLLPDGRGVISVGRDVSSRREAHADLEAGKLTLRPEQVEIAELVRETAELAAPRAQEKGLEIGIVQSAAAPARIEGDPARLRQILFNLIGNAVKFTHQGGIRIDIGCAPDADGRRRLSLSVSDTGPGISEHDQQSLFEQFERGAAERDGAEGGAGLGLAMVRRLVEAMDSSMGVESRLGDGAKFWVIFDLPVFAGGPGESLAGRELAIASPNPVLRQTLADQLRELGADVVAIDQVENLVAASGRELLLDAGWASQVSQAHARHVWQLVTPAGKDDVIEDRPAGVNGWLVKPVRLTSLVEQITGSAPARPPASRPKAEAGAEPLALDGLRILVAEDDPVNALIARRTLERLGAHVTQVDSGRAALRALEDGCFDAALLDQRMPGMNGPDVARMARMSGHDLPLVALTANSSEDDRTNCLEAGMNDFLSKPVDPDLLARTLARLCSAGKQASMARNMPIG